VLWDDNIVHDGVQLRSCVVGRGNVIGAKCQIGGGAILSDNCALGPENRLDHGVRIWPNTQLGERSITF
jgi:mannose-1-phosphate guanylyltransferase